MTAAAQDGANSGYTPYSVYGIGDILNNGSAYNMSMGNAGIGVRTPRYINYLNPASPTSRDSLSFMADFGIDGKASLFRDGSTHSFNNLFNINNFVMSFPLFRNTALMAGIVPYSNVGYDFTYIEQDPEKIGLTGNQGYTSSGNGGIYEVFAGGAVTLWNRLSLGAQYIYYFGNIDKATNFKFSNSEYRSINSGYTLQVHSSSAKFGLQYEQPVGSSDAAVIGATYKLKSSVKGYATDFRYASVSSLTDTLKNKVDTLGVTKMLDFAGEWGVGFSYRHGDKWSLALDYVQSDWTGCGLENIPGFSNTRFTSSVSRAFRAGFEYTPNRNDIRYYLKRCTYRVGAYYEQSYYRVNGNSIDSFGITLGGTLPVFRGYNGITFALDMGQKGFGAQNIKENYLGFRIGFNIFDIWFQKPRYE